MGTKKFDPKQLWALSPDADDWNDLIQTNIMNLNIENNIYGVLLYPKKGISQARLIDEVIDFMDTKISSLGHGSLETSVVIRGEMWAICYQVTSWYNHFDLNEEYD
jgi:hypothetical protein